MKKFDAMLIISLILLCAISVASQRKSDKGRLFASIIKGGEIIRTIDLNSVVEPYEIAIEGRYPTFILVEPRSISFQRACCPDKICEKTGKLSFDGQTATCLPASISISLHAEKSQIDAISG